MCRPPCLPGFRIIEAGGRGGPPHHIYGVCLQFGIPPYQSRPDLPLLHRQGQAVVLRGVAGQKAQQVDGAPGGIFQDFPVEIRGPGKAHVIRHQEAAGAQEPPAVRQGRVVGFLVDVQEDQVKGLGHLRHQLQGLAHPDLHHLGEPGPGEVAPGPLGHGLVQFQGDHPARNPGAGPAQIDAGIPGGGAQFQDAGGAGGPGQDKEEFPHHGADDGDGLAGRLRFQLQKQGVAVRRQSPEITLQIGHHFGHGSSCLWRYGKRIPRIFSFFLSFGYYYARKPAGGEGRGRRRPDRFSCRVAGQPVVAGWKAEQAQVKWA